jgi:hypothetical protein
VRSHIHTQFGVFSFFVATYYELMLVAINETPNLGKSPLMFKLCLAKAGILKGFAPVE